MSRPTSSSPLSRALSLTGAAACLTSLVAIWVLRASVEGTVYVSGLGAPSMPTARAFNTALLVLAAGGVLTALGSGPVRSRVRVLRAWTASASLVVAGSAFAAASRVTCTDGCPVPFTPTATAQDLVHVTAAVVGFAAAVWAMLQVATADGSVRLRRTSVAAGVLVGAVAAAGGLSSVLAFHTEVGALLELAATTVAVLWVALVAIGGVLGRREPRLERPCPAPVEGRT